MISFWQMLAANVLGSAIIAAAICGLYHVLKEERGIKEAPAWAYFSLVIPAIPIVYVLNFEPIFEAPKPIVVQVPTCSQTGLKSDSLGIR